MMPAADGSQVPVDIIDGIFEPNSLALDLWPIPPAAALTGTSARPAWGSCSGATRAT